MARWILTADGGIYTDQKHLVCIFASKGQSPYDFPIDTWQTVDVTLPPFHVPSDSAAIYISGEMIITHGSEPESCNLTLTTRGFGDSDIAVGDYIGQTVNNVISGGERSNHSTWVPLIDGKFQWAWHYSTPYQNQYPSYASYGLNFSLQRYVRASGSP